MWDMFLPKPTLYNLRSGVNLKLPQTRSQKFGVNSLIFRGSLTKELEEKEVARDNLCAFSFVKF